MAELEIRDVSIEFPGVKALDKVSLDIEKGQVVALCGENGAGKSTLGKIIAGVYPYGRYSGKILYEGMELKLNSTIDAERIGIAIAHQELNLFYDMTVAENIFLGNMPHKAGVIDFEKLNQQAIEFLKQIKLDVDPRMLVRDLTVSKRQMVEIAKAISRKPKVLILDEATSSMTDNEVASLFNIIRKLKSEETTILYVSHKLNEIFEICDSIVVLKDGTFVKSANVIDICKDDIIRWTVGREVGNLYPPKMDKKQNKETLLKVQNWNVTDAKDPKKKVIQDLSFDLKKGEILGVYGLVGAGRTELVNSIFEGRQGYGSGNLYLANEKKVIKSPAHAIQNGIALITEDRKKTGLLLELSVGDNMSLASLKKVANIFQVIDKGANDKRIQSMVSALRVKVPNVKFLVNQLSGGNQQKVVLGKWLLTNPSILILDEPTRGIDVGAKAEIYKIIRDLAKEGIAILIVSSELPEILGISDRVLVMRNGEICKEFCEEVDEETLVRYAMGGEAIGE